MPSFARAALVALLAAACLTGGRPAAQTRPPAQNADALYNDLVGEEAALRRELDLAPQRRAQPPGEASTALLRRVRAAANGYTDLVRRFPRSGYADDGLWRAARLSTDAFWQFGDTRDRASAVRLFGRLRAEFPSSVFTRGIAEQLARLEHPPAPGGSATPATLTALRREMLPDVLRVTLELEQEAAAFEEHRETPTRVLLELRGTQVADPLRNATVSFQDDVVRQARVEPVDGGGARIAFDLQITTRHSVYSLYNPYRIVIDFERQPGRRPIETASKPVVSKAGGPPNPPTPAAANAAGGYSLARQLGLGVSRIVIDPGHGGRDPGAQVRGLSEADVALGIALDLEQRLSEEPDVEVILTRRANVFVALEERIAIANRAEADLFLSIHLNASANQAARGFETYVLSFAATPEAEALAARENAGSIRTMAQLPDLVKAIALNNKIDESRDFATMVQRALQDRLRKTDRTVRNLGVKQAPFMVLVGATMPSVLVEVSFLTNRNDATLLRSESYRDQVADALFSGVMAYQRSLKKTPAARSTF
jgi:N-acetylmuramoyl-L-alanine amidase